MKLRTLFIFTLIICLSITQIMPIFAEQAKISPFVNYEEDSTYKLSRYDVINIAVLDEKNAGIPGRIRIGIDGYVNLPMIGSIKLGGLTVEEASDILSEKYGDYLKNVDLSIIVEEYGARQVYVMGEVNRQGVYNLPATSMNIFAAITSAGGITRRGRPKHIALVRMVGDELTMQEINLDDFVKKQDSNQNLALLDGDMIYVPRSNKILLREDIIPIASAISIYKTITR